MKKTQEVQTYKTLHVLPAEDLPIVSLLMSDQQLIWLVIDSLVIISRRLIGSPNPTALLCLIEVRGGKPKWTHNLHALPLPNIFLLSAQTVILQHNALHAPLA